MAIKINTKKIGIPVEIGKLKFTAGTSDAELDSYVAAYKGILVSFNEMTEETTFAEMGKVFEEGYDLMLGEGAFDKVYEQTPSSIECAKYLIQLYEAVFAEVGKVDLLKRKQKVDSYLKNK